MSSFGVLVGVVVCMWAVHARAATLDLQSPTGTVTGVIADDTGAPILEASVTLTPEGGAQLQVATGADGRFLITGVPLGSFQLTVSALGFAGRALTGRVAAGEATDLSEIRLRLAVHADSIDVTPSVVEIAEQQIKLQGQQRVFGVVPNFYISFVPDAAPLNARQKLQLSWKARTDPMQFAFAGFVSGVQQWRNDYSGFGDGVSGYAKRYAAAYATGWTRSMITQVLLPSILRQDPRYFYKGTGSKQSRVLYAMSRSVIRKGDNGRWQPNYSSILGSLASGAVSNFYYPEEDRRGARLTLQNAAIGIGGGAIRYVTQEFLYARFTSRGHRPSRTPLGDLRTQGPDQEAAPAGQQPPKAETEQPPRESEPPKDPQPSDSHHMFGILPNYGTVEGAVARTPIAPSDKMKIAVQNASDSLVYPTMGAVAIARANYGRDLGGYFKQYGASLIDNAAGSFFTAGALPSMLHQDPRYFQRGCGGWLKRMTFAASRVAVTTTDSGHRQFNWSEMAGHLATAGLSNVYYPAADKTLSGTLSRWKTFIALDALSYELKEFWPDVRRWLHRPKDAPRLDNPNASSADSPDARPDCH